MKNCATLMEAHACLMSQLFAYHLLLLCSLFSSSFLCLQVPTSSCDAVCSDSCFS